MGRIKRILGIFYLLIFTLFSAEGQEVVMFQTDREAVVLGESFEVRYWLPFFNEGQGDVEWQWEEVKKRENIEVLGADDYRTDSTFEISLQLAVFDTGQVFVPTITAVYRLGNQELLAKSDSMEMNVLIPEGYIPELLPIETIITEPEPLDWWIFSAVVLAVVLALLLMWIFSRKKKRQRLDSLEFEQPKDPNEVALAELRELSESDFLYSGQVEAYYTRLSYIWRKWIENRFGIKALEMTESELSRELGKLELETGEVEAFGKVLKTMGYIKYARAKADPEFHRTSFSGIKAWVEKTQEQDNAPDPEDADAEITDRSDGSER